MAVIEGETGAQRSIGYVLDVGQGDGSARCHLDVSEAHANRHGVLHGGIVSMMLDNAMGATGSLTVDETGRAPFLTVSMTTSFVGPADIGKRVTATGRCDRRRSIAALHRGTARRRGRTPRCDRHRRLQACPARADGDGRRRLTGWQPPLMEYAKRTGIT